MIIIVELSLVPLLQRRGDGNSRWCHEVFGHVFDKESLALRMMKSATARSKGSR